MNTRFEKWIAIEVQPNGTYSPPRRRFQITNEDDTKGVCTVNISASYENDQAEANALMIAAAPEMLEVLKVIERNDALLPASVLNVVSEVVQKATNREKI